MELTHEILKEMDENFVIDFFYHVISNEIKNNVKRINNVLLISLSNGSTVQISAPKVASDTLPPVQTEAEIQNIETIRYVLLHDYGYNKESECKEINKLELHNLDE
ncbi:MAG: hypothetical protein MJ054_02590, partial [Clostridia bacterium]|nr:hypothetical protein [Clostridia bacterium]